MSDKKLIKEMQDALASPETTIGLTPVELFGPGFELTEDKNGDPVILMEFVPEDFVKVWSKIKPAKK